MNGWRGSLTIEAALVVPLVLALFAFAMKSGIQMYTECRDTALAIGQEQEIEAVKMFYRWQEAGELFQNEDVLTNLKIEPPKVFSVARSLLKNGLNIDLGKIKDVSSLAKEIARVEGKNE